MDKAAREEMQASVNRLQAPTKFERYLAGALHDIHRRVFEEGWFGKTVHDVVSHYHYNGPPVAILTKRWETTRRPGKTMSTTTAPMRSLAGIRPEKSSREQPWSRRTI